MATASAASSLAALRKALAAARDTCMVSGSSPHTPIVRPLPSSGTPAPPLSSYAAAASLCDASPLGQGEETVVDLSRRRSLETREVEVAWDGLPAALEASARALCPWLSLEARFHKLLVYGEGDFFASHVDARRGAEHVLTLAVDVGLATCDGGTLLFAADGGAAAAWEARRGGEWCCWFASHPHEVLPVRRGGRVVATFDVLARPAADEPAAPPAGAAAAAAEEGEGGAALLEPPAEAAEGEGGAALLELPAAAGEGEGGAALLELPAAAGEGEGGAALLELPAAAGEGEGGVALLELPGALLRMIFERAGVAAACCAACTCTALRAVVSDSGLLLRLLLRQAAETFAEPPAESEEETEEERAPPPWVDSMGFPLRHKYSFDGAQELPLHWLRGRDRRLLDAVQEIGGEAKVVPCDICPEICVKEDDDATRRAICTRIAKEVQTADRDQVERWLDDRGPLPDALHELVGAESLSSYERFHVKRTYYDLDGSMKVRNGTSIVRWPFRGVLWVCSQEDLLRHFDPAGERTDTLWGNEATFRVYWYRHAVLLWHPPEELACRYSAVLPFSPDVNMDGSYYTPCSYWRLLNPDDDSDED
ncbi:hypothetical protein AB1Y20_004422 [Prymnesium parvum]|uniref:Fe2OG dioxygenase domain-containing protein n=1 Tax=Prymnesium parvum TaxID=97485 RepID=A0AB34IYR6_PRYPA